MRVTTQWKMLFRVICSAIAVHHHQFFFILILFSFSLHSSWTEDVILVRIPFLFWCSYHSSHHTPLSARFWSYYTMPHKMIKPGGRKCIFVLQKTVDPTDLQHLISSLLRVGHLSRLDYVRGVRRVAQGPKFKIPLPRGFVPRSKVSTCQVSSTSAYRSPSLRALKMLTQHGWTDGHLTSFISHLGRDG